MKIIFERGLGKTDRYTNLFLIHANGRPPEVDSVFEMFLSDDLAAYLPELSAYIARSDAKLCKFYDSHSDMVWKGAAIDKHSAKLVNFSVGIHMRFWNKICQEIRFGFVTKFKFQMFFKNYLLSTI